MRGLVTDSAAAGRLRTARRNAGCRLPPSGAAGPSASRCLRQLGAHQVGMAVPREA
jgi:hypothetical protein